MRRVTITIVIAVVLLAMSVSPAMAGVLSVKPPGHGGAMTARCVGPAWGTPAIDGAWNAHWNGQAPDGTSSVIHDLDCPH